MSDLEQTLLKPSQLLELESICDDYELALRNGVAADIEMMIRNAPAEIQKTLRVELENVLRDYRQKSSDLTQKAVQDTVSPNEVALPPERILQFSSSVGPKPAPLDQSFGRFRLHSVVGRGGSGVVWRAFDGNLDRWVALKLAHPHTVEDSKRFVREAQAVAKLKHPNIIPVFEAGEVEGRCFLVSEFCEGQPLSQFLDGQPLHVSDAIEIILAICEAISHSHQNGIIHRDIKPHNIMMSLDGTPLVTDFGLAKNLVHDQTLTLEGELIGTPDYMAPEQARGGAHHCNERTDIYSIGVVMFQLLTGKLPFSGGFERIVFQVVHSPPPRLRSIERSVPVELETICAKCMEKSADKRYQSVEHLLDELRRFASGRAIETKRVNLFGRYLRWLKREPRIAWATTLSSLLLVVVAVVSTYSALLLAVAWRNEKEQLAKKQKSLAESIAARQDADEARKTAESAEAEARRNALLATQLARANRQEANFLATVFAPIDLMGVNQMLAETENDSNVLSDESIHDAVRQANHLLSDAPLVQSRVKGMLANAWRSRGQLDRAESLLDESTRLLDNNDQAEGELLMDARAMNLLYRAYLFHHREDFSQSDANYEKAIGLFQQLVGLNPDSRVCQLQLAQAEFGLGASLLRQKRNGEAKPYVKRVLDARRKHLAKGDSLLLATELAYLQCDPKNSLKEMPTALRSAGDDVAQKAMALYWSMVVHRKRGKFEFATKAYRELIQLIVEKVGKGNWLYSLAVGDFAGLQQEAGNYPQAFLSAVEAIERSKSFARWHPKRMQAIRLLAYELQLAGRHAEAVEFLSEMAAHELPKWNDSYGFHNDSAWCYYHTGEFSKTLLHSKATLRAVGNCTPAETAWYCYTHGTMLKVNGHEAEAQDYFDEAIQTAEKMVRNSNLPDHSTWLRRVGIVLTFAKRDEDAEIVFRRAIHWAGEEYFLEHPRVAGMQIHLSENLIRQGRPDQAKPLLEIALATQKKSLPADDKRLEHARALLKSVSADIP